MWQLWFVYWGFFYCHFNSFFFPQPSPKGSIWVFDWRCLPVRACWCMLIFWVRTELVDTGSESPRVTCSTTFCSWLLLLTCQLLLLVWLVTISLPFPVWSPIFHSSSLVFPNILSARLFCALSCRCGSTPSLWHASLGPGYSLLLLSSAVVWHATLQLGGSSHRQAQRLASSLCHCLHGKVWLFGIASVSEKVLHLHRWCLLDVLMYCFSYKKGNELFLAYPYATQSSSTINGTLSNYETLF